MMEVVNNGGNLSILPKITYKEIIENSFWSPSYSEVIFQYSE